MEEREAESRLEQAWDAGESESDVTSITPGVSSGVRSHGTMASHGTSSLDPLMLQVCMCVCEHLKP